jgi:hypothetical protein
VPSKVHETVPQRGYPGSFQNTPLRQVRRLFIRFAQGLFFQAPAGSYHWTPDLESTEIVITDENPIEANVVGKRPAINFTRGPVRFYSLGLDDLLEYRMELGQKTKAILVPGTMSINCCSSNDLESEQIAWVLGEHIWLLRDLFMKAGFFEVGREIGIGSPSPAGSIVAADEGQEWYCTTVSCPLQFPRMSKFTPLGQQIVDSIKMTLGVEHSNVSTKGPPAGGHELPYSIRRCLPESFAPNASDSRGATPDPAGLRSTRSYKVAHPLNPAARVVARTVHPYQQRLRPPSMGGVPIPIADPCVEESDVTQLTEFGKVVET